MFTVFKGRINLCGLNALVINSESPIMDQCHVKERDQSISPWSHLAKSEPRFEFSTGAPVSSILCLSAVRV